MSRRLPVLLAGGLTSVAVATGAPLVGDAAHGQAIYESRCTACHSLDQSRIGPAHRGVFGRHVASVPGFDYSPALRRSNVVWGAKTLDHWLTNPEAFIPGQKMGFSVPDPQDRVDVIAFLASPAAR
jgi:cytochrome c